METIQFEAVKTALKQSKDGYILTLAVHPDNLPDDLMRDFVGSRYVCVLVRVGDDEKPLDRKQFKGDSVVSMAGMVCRDPDFWRFIREEDFEDVTTESECVEWFKCSFNVGSRAELKTNTDARMAFIKYKEEFEQWKSQEKS